MFALPQATTTAVTAVKDRNQCTPSESDDKRASIFSGASGCTAAALLEMPTTPQARPSADTDVNSTRIAPSSGGASLNEPGGPGSTYQVSISTGSSSSAQRQAGSGGSGGAVKKKKSFMGILGLRSRKSSNVLSRNVSSEASQTIGEEDSSGLAPSSSPIPGTFSRKRNTSSPKTPDDKTVPGQKKMASLMSTDSVSSIATVSPLGHAQHLPTPLRMSSTQDAVNCLVQGSEGSSPVASGRDMVANRVRVAPPLSNHMATTRMDKMARTQPGPSGYSDREMFTQNEKITPRPGLSQSTNLRHPLGGAAETHSEQPDDWAQYVEAVKRDLERQSDRELQDPLGSPPHHGTLEEIEEYESREQARTEEKKALARRFVDRTSSYGLMLKDGWQSSYPSEVSVYDTLQNWQQHHVKSDPHMKETVLKRMFRRVKQEFSSTSLRSPPLADSKTPIITDREMDELDEESSLHDGASDPPLASTPDEEHYQVKGLGISSPSTSIFDYIPPKHPARLASLQARLARPQPERFGRNDVTETHIAPVAFSQASAPLHFGREDQSGWETVHDDEIDIDDDLIEAANAAGSTPDLRRKFREQDLEYASQSHVPPVPKISQEMQAKHGMSSPIASPTMVRKHSTLLVRRNPSQGPFSPQLDNDQQQANFDRAIQAAAQRRTEKISKVPIASRHPALRLKKADEVGSQSSSLPLRAVKTRASEIPTPTKTKPPKPAKPLFLTSQQVKEAASFLETASRFPEPPKYGQRVSPGKGLESPEASRTFRAISKIPELPELEGTPIAGMSGALKCTSDVDEDPQCPQSPVEQHMEHVAAAWHGPRTPSMPTVRTFDSSPSMQEAQQLRQHFGLPKLEFKRENEPPHPNHKYVWDTQNLMCQGIHRGAYEPLDPSPSESNLSEASPLRRFGTSASLVPVASYNTFSSIDFNYEGKSCHVCRRTCCFYAEQLVIMNMGSTRDETCRAAVEKARGVELLLRKTFPAGVERFDAHMKCSGCGVVCCHEHGVVCKTLSCRAALCERCSRRSQGKCRKHGEGE